MELIIHLPECNGVSALDILKQLKLLLATLPAWEVDFESWQIDADEPVRTAFVHSHKPPTVNSWHGEWDKIGQKKLAFAFGVIGLIVPGTQSVRKAGFTVPLVPAFEHLHNPSVEGERFINMSIHPLLWKAMDQSAFVETVKKVYVTLRATYAAIDEYADPMRWEAFRRMCPEEQIGDIEDRLPAIHWLQIVSERILKKTGSLNEIAEKVPCERVERIECPEHSSLLMQITRECGKSTPQKRLALRAFLQDSLYPIDPKLLNRLVHANLDNLKYMSAHMQAEIMRTIKRLPLTKEEIELALQE